LAPVPQTMTVPFTTLDEFQVIAYYIRQDTSLVVTCSNWTYYTTNPLNNDTDGDGIIDGWELYVGMGPRNELDAPLDIDDDGLTALQEFRCADTEFFYTNDFPHVIPEWQNKFWPTDPNDRDTDSDQVWDGQERAFIYAGGAGEWVGSARCYTGGGLNPTSADTDTDYLPDGWEYEYSFSADVGAGEAEFQINRPWQPRGELHAALLRHRGEHRFEFGLVVRIKKRNVHLRPPLPLEIGRRSGRLVSSIQTILPR